MTKPCVCGTPGSPSKCHFCIKFETDSRYRELWGGDSAGMPIWTAPPDQQIQKECAELGKPLPDQNKVPCAARLRDCALHGQCTTSIERPGVACCRICPDHTGRL